MSPFYVLYDGKCGFCMRAVSRLRAMDLSHRLTLVNAQDRSEIEKHGLGRLKTEDLLQDMHAVEDKKVWRGYDAYRAIAARVPLLWPVWPFLWIWPVTALGRKVYRRVADTRSWGPGGGKC